MFVQGVRDLQPADERECGDVLTAVGDLSQLTLEIDNVRFEVVALPHLDKKKVVVVSHILPMRYILGEERFGHLLEVVARI